MTFRIGKHEIGHRRPVFIVAEISANHLQKYGIAVKTLLAVKKTGAHAVKLQTYTPDTITVKSNKKIFTISNNSIWDGQSYYNLYKSAYTPWHWQPKLKKIANKIGLELFSTPFDRKAVDFLKKMDVPAYKIASFEITDLPLISYIASQRKPVILSTGVASADDIRRAVATCRSAGNNQIALLKCTSEYPTPPADLNLRSLLILRKRFNSVVGLSDHSPGTVAPVVATALGASIIEKHIILNRAMGGPDSSFSLEPNEFKEMVKSVQTAEASLGYSSLKLTAQSKKNRIFCRSLYVTEDVKKGERFTQQNVKSLRPNYGLPPKLLPDLLGKVAKKNIQKNTPLRRGDY